MEKCFIFREMLLKMDNSKLTKLPFFDTVSYVLPKFLPPPPPPLSLSPPTGQFGALLASSRSEYAQVAPSSVPIYWDEVLCHGEELALSECHHRTTGVHDCSHYEDAGVFCTSMYQSLLPYTFLIPYIQNFEVSSPNFFPWPKFFNFFTLASSEFKQEF